jgi:hypothetical protein
MDSHPDTADQNGDSSSNLGAVVPRKSVDIPPANRLAAAAARSVLLGRTAKQRKRHGRSRLTNNKDLLPGVDGRSVIYRRFRDIASQVAIDQGGLDQLSEARLQLVRRFSATCVLAEQLEAELANGQEIDVERHALLCSTLTRLAQRMGAAAAWPIAARAQQPERVRRIGVLMGTADDREGQARVTAFKQGLQELGWTDGRNIQIETRFGGADTGRIRADAAELVALAPDGPAGPSVLG